MNDITPAVGGSQRRGILAESLLPQDYDLYGDARRTFDFRIVYAVIKRHLLLIVLCVVTIMVLTLIGTMLTTPKYRATASLQIEEEVEQVFSIQQSTQIPNYQDTDRFLQTQMDLLQSRALAQRVAQSLNLFGDAAFFAAMQSPLPAGGPGNPRVRDATIRLVQNGFAVTLPRQSRIASISFLSADPALSARIVNGYADGFIEYNLQRKYDSSAYARSFLSKQLATVKAKLEESERQVNAYAREARLIKTSEAPVGANATPQNQSITTASLVQLNEAANLAQGQRIAAEQKWRSASAAPIMSISDVLTNQAVQQLLQQRAQRSAELRNELALHQAAYPTVQNLQAQVAELDRQIATVAKGIKDSIQAAYRVASAQERQLNAQVATLKSATLAEQDRGVRYGILAREADTNRTLYDGLLQRFKEVSAQAGITSNNISVVDQAVVPSKPASPRLLLNLALAFVGSLVVAGAAVFVREQMDDVVRGPQDVENKLGFQLLGVIPHVGKKGEIRELLEAPRSAIAESYHALRTSVLHSSADGLPKTILFTSTQAGEGKSTTSYAVAADLARLGLRVVLVDTDLRRPSLHRLVGLPNSVGLTSVLARQIDIPGVLVPISDHPGLSLITSGPIPPSPTELLASGRMADVLHQLKESFDVVVLDGPPVLGLADAPILAAQVEATLFIVESNSGHRGATKSALRRLVSSRGKVLGVVLTKFDARKSSVPEYYGYQYYYYGHDPEDEQNAQQLETGRSSA